MIDEDDKTPSPQQFDYGSYDAAGLLSADLSDFVELRRVSSAEGQLPELQTAAQAVQAAEAPATKPESAPPMVPRAIAQKTLHRIGTTRFLLQDLYSASKRAYLVSKRGYLVAFGRAASYVCSTSGLPCVACPQCFRLNKAGLRMFCKIMRPCQP